jgi:hypothetical protein
MAHEIAGITQCVLCEKSFIGPPIIVGQQPKGRAALFMQRLTEHFMKEHPRENKDVEWKSIEYLGILRMRSFRTTDAGLGRMIDELRWQNLQQLLNAHIPDSNITTQCNNLAGDIVDVIMRVLEKASTPEEKYEGSAIAIATETQDLLEAAIAEKLVPHFKEIRNALEEPGKYPATLHPDYRPERIITV